MRSRSSIFSSDTLASSLWPTRGLLFALAVCIAYRILIGWLGPSFTGAVGYWLVDHDLGWARTQMGLEPVAGKPRCLVLGSSRVGLGVDATVLADQFEWQVIKTPLNAATPWTFLRVFEAEPQLLDGVQVMVIDVEYFQFNNNSPAREGLRFLRLTDTFDPLWSDIKSTKGIDSGLREYLWPVQRERRELMELVKGLSLYATDGGPYRPMDERWNRYEADPDKLYDPGMEPVAAARRVMKDFEFSEFMLDTWHELADLCQQRDIELFVIHPPVKEAFVSQLTSRDDWTRNRERIQNAIRDFDHRPSTSVIFTELLVDVGLKDEDLMFMDYGHLTSAGARHYTTWLGEAIRSKMATDGDS